MKSLSSLTKIYFFAFLIMSLLVVLWFCKVYDFHGEKILLPQAYEGPISIYYERINGESLQRDKSGAIIYRIPKSGKLVVNFEDYIHRGTPLQNREYFFYDIVTGKILDKVKKYEHGSGIRYYLVDFQYGPDSLGQTGKNYYSESFTVSK